MKRIWPFLLLSVLGGTSLLCTRDFSALGPEKPIRDLTQGEQQIVQSSGDFGFSLFQEIQQTQKDENIFISPISVSMALGMTYNGAAGETARAMQNVLGFGGLSREEINRSYRSLIELLSDVDPQVRFQIANSIWYRLGFEVEPTFIDINKKYFGAEVSGLDFGQPSALETINGWVNANTNGKIEKIIERIDPLTVMFLINAIYFKGTWTYEFKKEQTAEEPFYLADGSETTCQLMKQGNEFLYFEDDEKQVIDMPYGKGAFRMTVILPRPEHSVDELIMKLEAGTWKQWLAALSKKKGIVYLPRFKLKYEKTLNDVLMAMGMGIAFLPGQADFSGISKKNKLYVSRVKHKSFVDVNEEGTEAAAVTLVEIRMTSAGGESYDFVMRVDRPFLFVIREQYSGAILFMGKILNPNG